MSELTIVGKLLTSRRRWSYDREYLILFEEVKIPIPHPLK
jgi:hypothetical protein